MGEIREQKQKGHSYYILLKTIKIKLTVQQTMQGQEPELQLQAVLAQVLELGSEER